MKSNNPFTRHGIEHLSPSKINLWITDPALFIGTYLCGMKGSYGVGAFRGSAVEHALEKKLSNKDLTFQEVKKNNTNSYHLFIVLFPNKKKILNNYDKIFREFLKNKISVMLHYRPIHLHPFFKKKGFKDKDYPVSENYAKRAFSIPNFFLLNKIKQDKVISTINKILKKFS